VRDEPPLLRREDIRQLERLSLESLEAIRAGLIGRQESPERGSGLEFADYRRYTPGDDLRRIDWNVYGRFHELLVKTAPTEARVWLSVLLDTSRSMDSGEPNKLYYARRLAALLGTVALLRTDAVQVQVLSDGEAVAGGRFDAAGMLSVLAMEVRRLPTGRTTRLESSVRHARAVGYGAELSVLISDALVPPDDLAGALRELARTAPSAVLIHILDPEESTAGPAGSVELHDVETGANMRAAITEQIQARYAEHYEEFRMRTIELCRANRVRYLAAPTSVEPLDLVVASAHAGEVLRAQPAH
jgi:uncharacterized protein (DUF58 family)